MRYTQPQAGPLLVDWGNPITEGLLYVKTPTSVESSAVAKIVTQQGLAYSFDPATPTPINTGVINANIVSHSCFALVLHPSMAINRSPEYLGNRVSGNNGFAFYQSNASGTFPTQVFGLGYVHGGVAAYSTAIDIPNANTQFIPIGFSATVSNTVSFYSAGALKQTTAIGGITNSSDSMRIGYDVYFATQPGDFQLPILAYWNRELTASEHASLAANPWQLFRSSKLVLKATAVPTAIAFDAASNSGYKSALASYSWNHTNAGNYLVVSVSMLSVAGSSVSSITYNGVAMSLLRARGSATGANRVEIWGLANPAAGTNTIAVTLSAALDSVGSASSYKNVNQALSAEGEADNSATNVGAADATLTVNTTANNDWVVTALSTTDTAVTAGQTVRSNVTGTLGSGGLSDFGPQTPAAGVAMNWTGVDAAQTWTIAGAALIPIGVSEVIPRRWFGYFQSVNRASTY